MSMYEILREGQTPEGLKPEVTDLEFGKDRVTIFPSHEDPKKVTIVTNGGEVFGTTGGNGVILTRDMVSVEGKTVLFESLATGERATLKYKGEPKER